MKLLHRFLAAVVLASVPALSFGQGVGTLRFPEVVGQTLSDKAIRLPNEIPPAGAVILLGFERGHQSFIDDWTSGLSKVQPSLLVLKVPVIEPTNALSRNFIQFGMRRATPEGDPRDRTITVFTDVQAFANALKLPEGSKVPYALAVDATGAVQGISRGRFDTSKGTTLVAALLGAAAENSVQKPQPTKETP